MIYYKSKRNIAKAFLQLFLLLLFASCGPEIEYVYKDSISVKSLPGKTSYFIGEKICYDGLAVVAVKENGESVEITDYEIVPPANTILSEKGKQNVIIKYKERELSFSINVAEIKNSLLYLRQIPKCAYYEGEKLDLSELALEILKTDGSKEIIKEYTAEPADGTVLEKNEDGKTKITVKYGELYASFDVSVYDKAADYIRIKKMPSKMNYYINDILDLSGMIVEAAFSDGTVREITDYTVSEISKPLANIGNKAVKILWLDKQVEFNVTVKNLPLYFIEQPLSGNFELYSDRQTLSCAVAVFDDAGYLQFSWYRKNPNENAYTEIFKSEPQIAENWKTYSATVTLPKNNYVKAQYYCEAIFTKDGITKIAKSDIAEIEQVVNTGIPTVFVSTENAKDLVYKTDKLKSTVKIVDADRTSAQYENVTFGGRGNSSWNMPKKSYSLKFDSKEEILGMKKSKKWVLIANYADKTLLRNDFASYLANTIFKNMEWNPSFKSVNLVKNGEYIGTYLLGEQIKLEESRVNIQSAADSITGKSKYKDLNGDGKIDIKDGGFIVEINVRLDENFNFKTTKGVCISLKDPDTDDFISGATSLSEEVSSYIKNIIQNTEDVIYSEDFADEENGYAKYIDVDSFIDWYFVNEIAKNTDAQNYSPIYMYYDPKDQKLHRGPIWDFDIGFGNINYNSCNNCEGFWIKNSAWYNRLFEDPNFVSKVKFRWNEISQELHNVITTEIQKRADSLSSSAGINFVRWPILGIYVWPNAAGYERRTTYQSEIDYMKDWLEKRYQWLSSSIRDL